MSNRAVFVMSYADINRIVLVGRLTRDPELRALPSGSIVCGLRIACNGVRKDGDVYQERPNYFDVSVFGAHGENVERYLHKSSRVALEGRLEWARVGNRRRPQPPGRQHRRRLRSVP